MLKGLGGAQASGAGGGGVVIPRSMGAEVALRRSPLVEAARGKFVQAHEGVGL